MNKALATLIVLFASHGAHAEIYKHIDEEGHVTYSNVPMKGATRLNLEPASPGGKGTASGKSGRASSTPTPADFPRVEKAEQKQRDDKRRQILEEELLTERKALEEAQKTLAENEAALRKSRNVAAMDEKLKKLHADVSTHERNVELLEKELRTIK
jgi:hypothetical protein